MFTLKNISVALLLSFLFVSTGAFASAGNIIYGYGDNYALDTKGKKRKLGKGDSVNAGDTLVTSKRGRMQVRFSDGGLVAVYPGSEYKIDEYDFVENDDSKQRGFFSLLKGGARQITGLLGKIRRDNFKFRTSVATIGIRGTGFFVKLCKGDCFDADGNLLPDGMYVKNDTGIITMSNDGGEIVLAQGQSAHSSDSNDEPEQIYEPPAPYNVASNDVETFDFDVGDATGPGKTTEAGVVEPPPPPPVIITANYLESVFIESVDGLDTRGHSADTANTGETITQNANTITAYSGAGGTAVFDSTGGTLVEGGADQVLGVIWSRWTGSYALSESGIPVSGLMGDIHLIGASQLTSKLPGSGIISYQSIGGTSPTFIGPNGNAVGTQDVSFDINYGGGGELTNLSVKTTFPGGTVNASQLTMEFISGNSSVFTIAGSCSAALCNTSTGVFGDVTINLVGTNAEGAFGVYGMSNGSDAAVAGSYLATGQ